MRIRDISPPVSPASAVFPGDVAYTREVSLSFARGHHLELSSIRTTLHVGAHADAPGHYAAGGASVDQLDLGLFLGPCRVLATPRPDGRLGPGDLAGAPIDAPRVLFATGSFPDPDRWSDRFASLAPELVDWLADRGVRLVGIDTPSVDPADSKGLEAHHRLAARGMVNLENLALAGVPPGRYTLVALPLRLVGAEAAPLRAVLVEGDWPGP